MQLIDLALHIPNFVPSDVCNDIIEFYESQSSENKFFEQSYSTQKNKNVVSSGLCLEILQNDSAFKDIHKYTCNGIAEWIKHIGSFGCFEPYTLKSLISFIRQYRVIKYSDGMFIHNHTDVGDGDLVQKSIRGSCTLNFSDVNDYEGGEFNMFMGKHEIKLGKGDLMIFPADAFWVHCTNPVTSGTRYAVNSFLHPNVSS